MSLWIAQLNLKLIMGQDSSNHSLISQSKEG